MGDHSEYPDAPEPLDALRRTIDAVTSGESEVEPNDLHALARLRHADSEQILVQVQQLEASVRFVLANRLQELGAAFGGYDFTTLFAAMLTDADVSVRAAAVSGLSICETAEATESLLQTARSHEEDLGVRREAVTALGAAALRLELGWASSETADGVADALRAIAEDVREADELRASAVSGVGVVDAAWVAPLIDAAFDSDSAALHLGAVEAMGRSADVAWLPLLEGALIAEDEDEQLAAVQAIGEIGSEDGAPLLLELFDDPTASGELLQAAVMALGEIDSEDALEHLEQLRTHPDPELRAAAQAALEAEDSAERFDGPGSPSSFSAWSGDGAV